MLIEKPKSSSMLITYQSFLYYQTKQRETLEYFATPLNSSASISPKAILRRKVEHRSSKLTHCHCSPPYPQPAKGIPSSPGAVKEPGETLALCEHHLSSAEHGAVLVHTAASHHLHSDRENWVRKAAHGEGHAKSNPDSPTALLLGLFCSKVQPTLR